MTVRNVERIDQERASGSIRFGCSDKSGENGQEPFADEEKTFVGNPTVLLNQFVKPQEQQLPETAMDGSTKPLTATA